MLRSILALWALPNLEFAIDFRINVWDLVVVTIYFFLIEWNAWLVRICIYQFTFTFYDLNVDFLVVYNFLLLLNCLPVYYFVFIVRFLIWLLFHFKKFQKCDKNSNNKESSEYCWPKEQLSIRCDVFAQNMPSLILTLFKESVAGLTCRVLNSSIKWKLWTNLAAVRMSIIIMINITGLYF